MKTCFCFDRFTVHSLPLLAVALAGALGCGGATQELEEFEELGSTESALSEAGCAILPTASDPTVHGNFKRPITQDGRVLGDAVRVNAPYDNPTCFKAKKVKLEPPFGPDPGRPVPVGSPLPTNIWVAPRNLPSTEADCIATSARAILYGHSTLDLSHPTVPGPEVAFAVLDKSAFATWNTLLNRCQMQWISLGHPTGGQLGLPYHVGVTARTSGVTRSVDVVATVSTLPPSDLTFCDLVPNCVSP
jgi:hypothetical protein